MEDCFCKGLLVSPGRIALAGSGRSLTPQICKDVLRGPDLSSSLAETVFRHQHKSLAVRLLASSCQL